MRITSIVAHPRPNSFCHAISNRVCAKLAASGHELLHHDLYAERFDPCLTAEEAYTIGDTLETALSRTTDSLVAAYRAELASSDGLVVVHPNWWGKPPAILAGWMDRVLVPGVAYRLASADGLPQGLLSIAKALVVNTSDTPEERENRDLGDPLDSIWRRCVLPYCGVKVTNRVVFRPVTDASDLQRKIWLDEIERVCTSLFDME